jgi:ketosteroid isomerase-like protein
MSAGAASTERPQAKRGFVRHHLEAYLARDNETALAAYDPAVEFDTTVRPDGRIHRGRGGVAEAMRLWTGAFENWRLDVKEYIDAGDRILVVSRQSGRGKASGLEIEQDEFGVFTLGDGRIVH